MRMRPARPEVDHGQCERCGIQGWLHRAGFPSWRKGQAWLCSECIHDRYIAMRCEGIDLAEYRESLRKRKGVCTLCGNVQERRLLVDWDSNLKKIKGFLCYRCNSIIKKFRVDKGDFYKRVAAYTVDISDNDI